MKRRQFTLIVVVLVGAAVVALSAVGIRRVSGEDRPAGSGEQWEYLSVGSASNVNFIPSDSTSMRKEPGSFGREDYVLEGNLDKLGKNGWELVTVTESPKLGLTFIFKRRR
jgi:hypothetical protein